MAALVEFVKGTTQAIDYTPSSAMTGGDVVVVGNSVFMAKEDVAASALGALHIGGVWDFPKTTGTSESIVRGTTLYWDTVSSVATATAGSLKKIGICANDSAAADADTTVRVLSIPQA